ncbi:MAG: hypothetical protein R2873_28285 [Caldilineaceae bacterium]
MENFLDTFRGSRITSQDPLVVEFYSDAYNLDAEWNVAGLYPYLLRGPGAWHTFATGMMAESNGELAFSQDKAQQLEVEWMSYIAGPSLEILAKYMDQAAGEGFIPYAPTLGEYISADEAAARWSNLQSWYGDRGHFWVGSGPMTLVEAFPVEGTIQLARNPDYPDASSKWARFQSPMLASTEVDGPGRVTIGEEAVFDVFIDSGADAYPVDQISSGHLPGFRRHGESSPSPAKPPQ